MTTTRLTSIVLISLAGVVGCRNPPTPPSGSTASAPASADASLAAFIDGIKSVDNHTHANSTAAGDTDFDALPLDGLMPIELPAPVRPESPVWLAAFKGLYQYPHDDTTEEHLKDLRSAQQSIVKAQGNKFPEWVLDHTGTEVLIANRIAMGPGLDPPRFRWASYADALMYPFPTRGEAQGSPDREKLFPLEETLFKRYMSDLGLTRIPATLDEYLKNVVTGTLESQRKAGCIAVKFEAAYLRALDFGDLAPATAAAVYAKSARGGEPSHADCKALQDFLFRYIAREAGRLGMAVHIHSLEGAGNYFQAAGADPLLLEPALNDPALRSTNFVIIHGGGALSSHAGALLWKANVYVDMSLMTLAYPPSRLAGVLKAWIEQMPEKVLYGSDASAFGPDMGWEVAAWVASRNARTALTLALEEMLRQGEITRSRAEEVARMVLRTNASRLYKLGLN